MKKYLTGLFKRVIVLPIMGILIILFYCILPIFILHPMYWLFTGRKIVDDVFDAYNWSKTK